jgi:hypothetical protein
MHRSFQHLRETFTCYMYVSPGFVVPALVFFSLLGNFDFMACIPTLIYKKGYMCAETGVCDRCPSEEDVGRSWIRGGGGSGG